MPLWGTIDWEEGLSLSPELLDRLATWQLQFDSNFHHEDGWIDTAERDAWVRHADALVSDLRREVPVDVPLVVDLWPIEDSKPRWKFWARRGPIVYR